MSKQVYIDENGNEIQVSGTVNTADMMPMSGNDSTKVSEAIGDLSNLTTSVTSSLVGAVNEVVANKVNGWTFVNETLGNTTINLPTGWKEILAVCRYGNGGGLQSQAVSFVLIPEQKGLTMTAGGSTILAQVVVSADTTKVNMVYFGVAGTEYTSDSQIRVWYR